MKKINKILPLISCLFLTSCNNSNDSSMYNYKEEENRTIVKDFSLDDARNCVRAYRYENYKTYNKSFGIDIYYYLGKNSANMGNIVLMGDFNPYNKMHETYHPLTDETIGDYKFNWSKLRDDLVCAHNPVYVTFDSVYTLPDAYELGYINDSDLTNVKDIFDNHLDEYKVFIRFMSYNSL